MLNMVVQLTVLYNTCWEGGEVNEIQRRMNKERMSGSEEESKLLSHVVS
jgi:hypothetical protein